MSHGVHDCWGHISDFTHGDQLPDSSCFVLSLAVEELLDVGENRPNDVIRVKSGWE